MSRSRTAARVGRVAAAYEAAELEAELRRLAAYLGIPVDELRAEVEEVDRLCRAAGAFTVETRVAAVARDLGIPADELRAEAERLREDAYAEA